MSEGIPTILDEAMAKNFLLPARATCLAGVSDQEGPRHALHHVRVVAKDGKLAVQVTDGRVALITEVDYAERDLGLLSFPDVEHVIPREGAVKVFLQFAVGVFRKLLRAAVNTGADEIRLGYVGPGQAVRVDLYQFNENKRVGRGAVMLMLPNEGPAAPMIDEQDAAPKEEQ